LALSRRITLPDTSSQPLTTLADLAERGVAFLITQSQEILNPRRQYFLPDLFKASDHIFRLRATGRYTLEARRYVPIEATRQNFPSIGN
jgi:hypothetical protein